MNCKYLRSLNRFADNELPAQDRIFMEKHLKECPECSAELKIMQAVKLGLTQNRISTNPEFFWQQLNARIVREEKEEARELSFDFGNWAKRLIPVPVIAAIAAVIILYMLPVKNNPVDEYLFGNNNSNILDLIEEPGNQSSAGNLLY
jgi:anti-sigma factor RsiW